MSNVRAGAYGKNDQFSPCRSGTQFCQISINITLKALNDIVLERTYWTKILTQPQSSITKDTEFHRKRYVQHNAESTWKGRPNSTAKKEFTWPAHMLICPSHVTYFSNGTSLLAVITHKSVTCLVTCLSYVTSLLAVTCPWKIKEGGNQLSKTTGQN